MAKTHFRKAQEQRILKLTLRFILSASLITLVLWGFYSILEQNYIFRWGLALQHLDSFNKGLMLTLQASGLGLVLALSLGLIVALLRLSPFALFRDMGTLYVHSLRNIPFIVFVLFMYFGFARAVLPRPYPNITLLGWDIDDRLFWGALALGLFEASFMSEIFRSGIQSIHKTQIEASRSLGMSYAQSMRYVVLPQAFRVIIPPLTGEIIALIKESALLLAIAVNELTLTAKTISGQRPLQFEFYTILASYYLTMTVPISILSHYLEQRFNIHRRRS